MAVNAYIFFQETFILRYRAHKLRRKTTKYSLHFRYVPYLCDFILSVSGTDVLEVEFTHFFFEFDDRYRQGRQI